MKEGQDSRGQFTFWNERPASTWGLKKMGVMDDGGSSGGGRDTRLDTVVEVGTTGSGWGFM